MTFNKERHDYVEQSAEVVEALAVHRKRHKDIQEADRDVILEARKVAALLAAFDATLEKQFELAEDVSESDDATLKRFTNEDAETWFWRMNTAQECVQEALVEQCERVSSAQYKYKKLQRDHKACVDLQLARDLAGKRYDEIKKQADKPKRGRPAKNK
tara:strand:- start:727 stop:1200 length:474 start_codon:yes stop_codon:yes gene_type:complete